MSRELILSKLKDYQSHASTADVHKSVELHIRRVQLNESALRVLRVLEFRSRVVPGACWLKAATIADVIGRSVSTVRRALRTLIAEGVIKKHETTRAKSGGDGANIFVILPVEHANDHAQMNTRDNGENPRHAEDEAASRERKEDSVKDAQIKNEVYTSGEGEEDKPLDKSFVPDTVPAEFTDAVWPYLRDAVKVHRLYTRAIIASRQLGDYKGVRDHVAVQAFKATVFALKAGKVKTDMFGYFFGTYRSLAIADIRREAAAERGIDLDAIFGADEETA